MAKIKKYRKGFRVERELLKYFESHDFLVIRAAGSGFNTPDLVVFKKGKQFAFEVKAHEGSYLYIKRKQFEDLEKWEEITAIPLYIAWKKSGMDFIFIPLYLFKEGKGTFSISFEEAIKNSLKKEDFVFS